METLGNDCLIGQYVTIVDHEAHNIIPEQRQYLGPVGNVTIGRNVWFDNNVTILKNSIIGDNSVVGANSVVTKDVPENSIAAGIPCKVIKTRGNS